MTYRLVVARVAALALLAVPAMALADDAPPRSCKCIKEQTQAATSPAPPPISEEELKRIWWTP